MKIEVELVVPAGPVPEAFAEMATAGALWEADKDLGENYV
jgi:hypothetical protein